MVNPIKWIGKKIADNFVDAAITAGRIMLVLGITSALGSLIVFWRGAPHPRLLAMLLGATGAFTVSALIFLVVAMIKGRGRPNRAVRKRVAAILLADKSRIKNFVMICGIQYREVAEGRKPAHIHFAFSILNMSLYNISVDSIDGTVGFYLDGEPYTCKLKPRLEENEKARNLGFRSNGYFVIEQNFETVDERNYVLDASADGSTFSFNSLTITLKGDELEPIHLRPDITFRKSDHRWLAHYDADFAFIGIAEVVAKVHELEAKTASLQSRLDQISLKPGDHERPPEAK